MGSISILPPDGGHDNMQFFVALAPSVAKESNVLSEDEEIAKIVAEYQQEIKPKIATLLKEFAERDITVLQLEGNESVEAHVQRLGLDCDHEAVIGRTCSLGGYNFAMLGNESQRSDFEELYGRLLGIIGLEPGYIHLPDNLGVLTPIATRYE